METIVSARRSYVAGRWIDGDDVLAVENPADESHVADVAVTPLAEVERAIAEARRSFDDGVWADVPARERAKVLHAFLDHVEAARTELVATIVAEAGQPTWFAEHTQVGAGVALGRATVDLALALPHEESNPVPVDELVRGRVALSIRRHEAVGVVAAITPYNATLLMAFQKVVPALMAGCSVIVRPSPLAPLSSLVLGAAADAAGLPPGVLSVVLERAPAGAAAVVAATAGQACVAATRMLVPEDSKDEVIEAVRAAYERIVVGAPTDPATTMGPVVSAGQRERCERYVALAEAGGGRVACGGSRPAGAGFERGYWFEPTVLDLPDNDNPAARDEIFGPVIGVLGYRDIDDAVRIANDSVYGLSAQVYGADVAAATAVARRLRTGAVNVNTAVFSAYAPGGGYKQSGLGRERGVEGIRAFQEVKHLAIGELPR